MRASSSSGRPSCLRRGRVGTSQSQKRSNIPSLGSARHTKTTGNETRAVDYLRKVLEALAFPGTFSVEPERANLVLG
jgi:hypothetical protein